MRNNALRIGLCGVLMLMASGLKAQKYHAVALEGFYGKIKQIEVYRNDTLRATFMYSKDGRLLADNGEVDTSITYGSGGYPVTRTMDGPTGKDTFAYEWEKKKKHKRLKRATYTGVAGNRVTDYSYDMAADNMGLSVRNGSKTWNGNTESETDDGVCVYTYSSPDAWGNVIHRRSQGKTVAALDAEEWDGIERIEVTYYKLGKTKENTLFVYNMPEGDSKEHRSMFKEKAYTNIYVPYDREAIALLKAKEQKEQNMNGEQQVEKGNMTSVDRFPTMYNYGFGNKWNTPRWRKRTVGISAGYVRKMWRKEHAKGNGQKSEGGMWKYNDGEPMNPYAEGIMAGLRIEPQFGYGIGLDGGLYYEGYQEKSVTTEGMYGVTTEFGVHIPLHLEYRANLSDWFQVFVYGGVGFEYILAGNKKYYEVGVSTKIEETKIKYNKEESNLLRYNLGAEFGAGIRIKGIQIQWEMSNGIIDMSANNEYVVKQCRPMSVSLSWMF